MKQDGYIIICEMIRPVRRFIRKPMKKPVSSNLGLTTSSTGLRRAERIRTGKDPMHSRPGYKQSASKLLKKVSPQQLRSAGVKV